METVNLVSTPNITGNIGSCTTSTTDVLTGRNLWTESYDVYVTNSCTGEATIVGHTWAWSGEATLLSLGVGVIIFLLLFVVIALLAPERGPYNQQY